MRYRNWNEKGERKFRLSVLALLILVLAAIHFFDPTFYPTIYHLSKDGDLRGTIAYLHSFGIYAAFMSFFIDVVINIVGFLPSIFISTANGLIFGLFWGVIISWLAETVGVLISFYVMRTLFRGMAMNIINKSKTLKKLDSYDSWQAMATPGHSLYAQWSGHGYCGPFQHAFPLLRPGLSHRQVCHPRLWKWCWDMMWSIWRSMLSA